MSESKYNTLQLSMYVLFDRRVMVSVKRVDYGLDDLITQVKYRLYLKWFGWGLGIFRGQGGYCDEDAYLHQAAFVMTFMSREKHVGWSRDEKEGRETKRGVILWASRIAICTLIVRCS